MDTMLAPETISKIVAEALRTAYQVHTVLRGSGQLRQDDPNRFGDPSFLAGRTVEQAMLETLRQSATKYDISFRIRSPEIPRDLGIGFGKGATYIVYMNGLDGWPVYQDAYPAQLRFNMTGHFDNRARYGITLAISTNHLPRFNNILAAGILEPTTHRLLVATKGGGTKLTRLRPVTRSAQTTPLREMSGRFYCDATFPADAATALSDQFGITTVSPGSIASAYLDVSLGKAAAAWGTTGYDNIAHAAGYLVVDEAGGAVFSSSGLPLGTHYIDYWGSTHPEYLIAAGSEGIAGQITEAVMHQYVDVSSLHWPAS
jgi:hypothetical protein